MNSRERVRRAMFRDGLPDRVPLQFDLSRQLMDRFSARYGIPAHYTTAYYEDLTYRISGNELRIAMGSDCVLVGVGLPSDYQPAVDKEGFQTNEFGMKMRQGPLYMELVGHPMAHVSDSTQVQDFPFPDPLAQGRFDDAKRYIAQYRQDYFVIGDIELAIFAFARHLVGMEKLLVDMAAGAEYLDALFDKCMNFAMALGKRLIELGVDGIWTGDDFGGQNGLLMSPKMWRRYFKERYRHLYAEFKAVNPRVLIMQHSDGAVAPILGEWIDAGLQVFNPVQPGVPGHEPEELKRKFGDRVSFWGAIDQQQLLPFGTPAEIAADVKSKIDVLGRGGGYMVSPAHIIQTDTPVENVEAFIRAVKEHGAYD